MTELFKFDLLATEAKKLNPFIGIGGKTKEAVCIRDTNGRCIIVCHGISLFGLKTLLRDFKSVKSLRGHFGIRTDEKVYLICCFGGKLKNNDPNTIVVNPYNRKCRIETNLVEHWLGPTLTMFGPDKRTYVLSV